MSQVDMDIIGLREQVMLVDAELAARGKDESGFGVPPWKWHLKKTELIKQKSDLIARLQSLRDAQKQRNIAESAVSSDHHYRVLVVLSGLRSIVSQMDDLTAEDRALLERSTEILQKAHVLP